ncbi:anhydro-N-acetylmuramic acid kinase [Winogradskyella flava]|uniref:anhydro-N-acetylmuramic acid kinase n=1 Tax=Winogradskyella flava TaxID=1884876 RepID=UPI002493CFCD|nr:anhydro-N-acetylmuramic acid kinase [Winogradskyella flava]
MIKCEYKVVAVMSGTSLDGIDLIYASYLYDNQLNFKIHLSETVKYPENWKLTLSQLTNNSIEELSGIDNAYSEYLASVVLNFINENKLKDIDFVASHGHTALHQPENDLTLQIGNQQIFADMLKLKVICDFRVQDVASGGQGAPLVPIGDRLLFREYDFCLNLGGFANVSFESHEERVAFDICPVNIVLNHYVSKLNLEYDDKGHLSSKGYVHSSLLQGLNTIEFYIQEPPKSLGLEWVQEYIIPLIDSCDLQTEDILRTFVEHIAIQISRVISKKGKNVLITGGGAYNDFLIGRISELSRSKVIIPNKSIIEFKEALVFGLLGVLRERNEINCLKSVTGAKKDHSSGKILIPKI